MSLGHTMEGNSLAEGRSVLPRVSFVIPLHNEKSTLVELHQRISKTMGRIGTEFEIVFVDDGSTDGSFEVLRELHLTDPAVRVVRFGKNRGKSDALEAGFRAADGEILITMDADLQDDPEEVPRMLEKMTGEGYDMVSGWKKRGKDPLGKRVLLRLFNLVTAAFSGIRLHDFSCGFKAYRRKVTDSFRVYGELHRFLPVLAHWNGFRVGELKVTHHPRAFGRSHYGISQAVKGIFDFITVMFLIKFEQRPMHLFGSFGLMCLLIGGGISLYFFVLWILGASMHLRPIMVGGWVLILLGIQFFSIGLLGEMLARRGRDTHEVPVQEQLG